MKDNTKYKILTPTGFESFSGIKELNKKSYLNIKFNDKSNIKCSKYHKFFINKKEIYAYLLKNGDILDSFNNKTITNIETINKDIKLYDIINVDNGNIFYANNIITHNCDCDFLTSGDTVIDPEILSFYELNTLDPEEMTGIDRGYWKWEFPDYNKEYLVAVDVSRGDGSDYSAFEVIEIATMTQVAEYEGKMDTRTFGRFIVSVAIEWNNALLVIENANLGWDVVQTAIEQNYQNLYYSYKNSDMIDTQTYINKGYDLTDNIEKVPGFTTSTKSRPLMVSKMELYFNQKLVIIRSKRLINQLRVFIWKNGKPQAGNGYNDDIVMSLAIGLWVRDVAVRLLNQGTDMTKKVINLISTSLNYYNNPGKQSIKQTYKLNQKVIHPYNGGSSQRQDPNEDLSWLL